MRCDLSTSIDLIFVIKEAYVKCLAPVCRKHSLSHMELFVLMFLDEHPGNNTAADMVSKRYFSKSHVSSSLDSLEQKGFLRRENNSGQRKNIQLTLLPPSETVIEDGRNAQIIFEQTMTQGLSRNDVNTFMECAGKAEANLRQYIDGADK